MVGNPDDPLPFFGMVIDLFDRKSSVGLCGMRVDVDFMGDPMFRGFLPVWEVHRGSSVMEKV